MPTIRAIRRLRGMNLSHALRSLRKNPLVTAMAVVSLALGIGASTAISALWISSYSGRFRSSIPSSWCSWLRTVPKSEPPEAKTACPIPCFWISVTMPKVFAVRQKRWKGVNHVAARRVQRSRVRHRAAHFGNPAQSPCAHGVEYDYAVPVPGACADIERDFGDTLGRAASDGIHLLEQPPGSERDTSAVGDQVMLCAPSVPSSIRDWSASTSRTYRALRPSAPISR
jgi:hypothetical protein